MIYLDQIEEKDEIINKICNELFEIALKNQVYETELLIVVLNGSITNQTFTHKGFTTNPHVIGPNRIGFSNHVHSEFIKKYVNENAWREPTKANHHENMEIFKTTNRKEYDKIYELEKQSIQLEMLMYLKIWESDFFIKYLYELTRIINGEDFDWNFKISQQSQNNEDTTGSRQKIIREFIRDRIQPYSQFFSDLLKDTYITQVRNAIAHSNYYFHSRKIVLLNYIKGDPKNNKSSIEFSDWENIMHNSLAIYRSFNFLREKIHKHFGDIIKQSGNQVKIRIPSDKGYQLKLVNYNEKNISWYY